MTVKARIYRPKHQEQHLRTPSTKPYLDAGTANKLYGCTDTSFAMLADAVTLGGTRTTEAGVRKMSSEPIPDPQSPGLNIPQGIAVMAKLRIACSDKSGATWADLLRYLDEDRRIVLQLDNYTLDDCGRTRVGHCIFLQARREITLLNGKRGVRILADNPACGGAKWYLPSTLKAAAEKFGDQTGVAGAGIRFAVSRIVPRMAVEA